MLKKFVKSIDGAGLMFWGFFYYYVISKIFQLEGSLGINIPVDLKFIFKLLLKLNNVIVKTV